MKTTKPLRSWKSTCPPVALGVAITALLAGSPADAGVKNWQGTVNGNWNTAGNWVENAVPTNGDQLVFSAATRYTITNNITNLRLDRITFTDGGYLVRGNGVTVTNGIVSTPPAAAPGNQVEIDVILGASQTFRCDRTNLYFAGAISLGVNTLTVTNPAGTEVLIGEWAGTGLISGTGGITKDGAGTLSFAGWSVANTYTGPTYVKNGTLLLSRVSVPAIPGPGTLTIGDGSGTARSAVVRYGASDQIGSVPVVINADGLLDLAGNSDTIDGAVTFAGGDITLGAGTLTLGGNVTVTSSDSVINGPTGAVNLPATRTFDVASGVLFDLQAPVTGSGGLTKTGAGWMRLGYPGTYSGVTAVAQGKLEAYTPGSLGATTSGTVVSNGASLLVNTDGTVTGEALTLNGAGSGGYGALDTGDSTRTNTWTGPITLNSDSVITPYEASAVLILSGPISGTGSLTKTGAGRLVFQGDNANTYAGSTYVNSGELWLGKTGVDQAIPGNLVISGTVLLLRANQINNNAHVTINSSGSLHLNFYPEGIGSLSGSGFLEVGYAGLDVGYNNASTIFSGVIAGAPGWIEAGLRKSAGSGTLTLTGTNTYTGDTYAGSGTLLINGYQPQSPVYVTAGGTLGGTGTVGPVNIHSGGSFRPGTSPGILTSSNLTMDVSSHYYVELNGITPGAGYDQVNVRGTVGLTNPVLHATLGFPSAIGNSFTIINNDGSDAVSGTFSGLPEGATVNVNGTLFRITYAGGSGNDVVLTHIAPPRLQIARAGTTNVVVSWPTNFTGFTLEARTNVTTNIWSVVSPPPVVFGTNYFVTNPASGSQRYYRLRLP